MVFRSAFILHVHPSLPVRTTAELIAYAKANPGKVNFSSSGTGAVNHLCLELFRARAGIDVVHVPYRGGAAALIDLRQNRVQAMFSAVQEALPAVREGATRALAISSKERLALLPDLPPVADALPGFNGVFWQGLFGPAGLPAPIVARAARCQPSAGVIAAAVEVVRATRNDPRIRRGASVRAAIAIADIATQLGGDVARAARLALPTRIELMDAHGTQATAPQTMLASLMRSPSNTNTAAMLTKAKSHAARSAIFSK
jgi:tripartite-type tricarboxylate transporter receptor subunit TctC